MSKQTKRPEGPQNPASSVLPPDIVARLNEAFYRRPPHTYFEQRLIRTMAELPEDLDAGMAEAVSEALGQILESDEESLTPEATALYVAAESEVLFHNVGESLLRFYLAHRERPPCPWVEMAALKLPREYRTAVDEHILGPSHEELVASVSDLLFDQPDVTVPGFEAERAAVDSFASFLRAFARQGLDHAALHNAAKHGFVVDAGWTEWKFVAEPGDDGLEELIRAAGTSVAALDLHKVKDPNTWRMVTTWVEPAGVLAHVWVGVRMLDSMFSVVKARYGGGGEGRVYDLAGVTPRSIISRRKHPLDAFRIPVLARPLGDAEAANIVARLYDRSAGDGDDEGVGQR